MFSFRRTRDGEFQQKFEGRNFEVAICGARSIAAIHSNEEKKNCENEKLNQIYTDWKH